MDQRVKCKKNILQSTIINFPKTLPGKVRIFPTIPCIVPRKTGFHTFSKLSSVKDKNTLYYHSRKLLLESEVIKVCAKYKLSCQILPNKCYSFSL